MVENGRFMGTLYMFVIATALVSSAEAKDISGGGTSPDIMASGSYEGSKAIEKGPVAESQQGF